MKYELVVVGALETNCYLAYDEKTLETAVIDPGADPDKIFAAVSGLGLRPTIVLNTHGHLDHIGANADLTGKFSIPLAVHSKDQPFLASEAPIELSLLLGAKPSPPPSRFLSDGDEVRVGRQTLRVLHIPGHSPGSVGFLCGQILFSGDTLFCGGVGRTDLPGGSWKDLESSIRGKILTLPGQTIVLPGHGPWTTVAEEKRSNPFVA